MLLLVQTAYHSREVEVLASKAGNKRCHRCWRYLLLRLFESRVKSKETQQQTEAEMRDSVDQAARAASGIEAIRERRAS